MDVTTLESLPPWEWPPETGPWLLKMLRDERTPPDALAKAARLAGDCVVVDDALAAELLRLVRAADKPEDVRANAAIALGPALELADVDGFDEPELVPISEAMFREIRSALQSVYTDASVPTLVRRRALEAAVRAPQDWQRDAVRAAWASGDGPWRVTAMFCMGHVPGFEREIVQALGSKDAALRWEAVAAAGRQGVGGAWKQVVALAMSDRTEKELRLSAIGALAGIHPRKARDLLEDLADSDDPEIEAAADEALADAGFGGLLDGEDADLDDEAK